MSEARYALSREKIEWLIRDRIDLLCDLHGIRKPLVTYDLRGRAAGQAIWPVNQVRLNWALLENNLAAFLENVVPHELCHLWHRQLGIVDRPHGRFWQGLMQRMGAEPSRCHNFEAATLGRRQRHFKYHCACSDHLLSARRHNRVLRGEAAYLCKRCQVRLEFRA